MVKNISYILLLVIGFVLFSFQKSNGVDYNNQTQVRKCVFKKKSKSNHSKLLALFCDLNEEDDDDDISSKTRTRFNKRSTGSIHKNKINYNSAQLANTAAIRTLDLTKDYFRNRPLFYDTSISISICCLRI